MPSLRTIAVTVAIVLATNFVVKRTPLAGYF
jgi:hypothetical protein